MTAMKPHDHSEVTYGESGTGNNKENSGESKKVSARRKKSATAFRTISEVADELDVQQHVLRFWETKFTQVKPLKRGGGRRYYRPEDVELLKTIHHLLYTEGYTIKGVQKLMKGQGKNQIISGDLNRAAPANQSSGTTVTVTESKVSVKSSGGSAEAKPQLQTQEEAEVQVVAKEGLSDKQRSILKAMLGDLKDLRSMISN